MCVLVLVSAFGVCFGAAHASLPAGRSEGRVPGLAAGVAASAPAAAVAAPSRRLRDLLLDLLSRPLLERVIIVLPSRSVTSLPPNCGSGVQTYTVLPRPDARHWLFASAGRARRRRTTCGVGRRLAAVAAGRAPARACSVAATARRRPPGLAPAPPEQIDRVRTVYGLPERFVLHVGTVEPRKDVAGLAAACRAWTCARAGGGSAGGQEAPASARLLGYVPQADLAPLRRRTVVAYRRYEGFGLPRSRTRCGACGRSGWCLPRRWVRPPCSCARDAEALRGALSEVSRTPGAARRCRPPGPCRLPGRPGRRPPVLCSRPTGRSAWTAEPRPSRRTPSLTERER